MSIKINDNLLKYFNSQTNLSLFGNWVNDLKTLQEKYANALPFEHVIIPNFLNIEYAEKIFKFFPDNFDTWHKYYNPLEIKYACDDINELQNDLKNLFYVLCTNELINLFSCISGINDLEFDPYLHGAGLHAHPKNGRLHMHLDYEKHPYMFKERRLNLILYMSKDWKEEWNGQTELWDKDMNKCVTKSPVKFNTAIIFKTNDISWHGLPERINCPLGIYRKSIAFYYLSNLISKPVQGVTGDDGTGFRTKATFTKRPNDPDYKQMKKLYDIRPLRRIENEDLKRIWPEWTEEIF